MARKYIDPYSGKEKSNRYFKKLTYKKKLEKLYEVAKYNYPSPAYYQEKDSVLNKKYLHYEEYSSKTKYLKRSWRGKTSRYLKTLAHRTVRRNSSEEVCDTTYDKLFDFWWELT